MSSFSSSPASCVLPPSVPPFRSLRSLRSPDDVELLLLVPFPVPAVVLGGLWLSYLLLDLIHFITINSKMYVNIPWLRWRSVCLHRISFGWSYWRSARGSAKWVLPLVHNSLKIQGLTNYRYPLISGLALPSVLPFEPSRKTLPRVSCSANGLRMWRFRGASLYGAGLYIDGIYCPVKLPMPELLGFISESHSCFKLFKPIGVRLFRDCRRPEGDSSGLSCDCDWAAANRPCSVDKPLT